MRSPPFRALAALAIFVSIVPCPARAGLVRYQEPDFPTFEELKQLSQDPNPAGPLGEKIKKFWKSPLVSNEAYYRGVKPHRPVSPKLGPMLVAASWNIEKSLNTDEAIAVLGSPLTLARKISDVKAREGSSDYKKILRQRERLAQADVLVLQEMDIGHKRSGYVNAAAELAKALDMNYAYGPEQLEIDPVYLGTENVEFERGGVDEEMTAAFKTDPQRYKGVFGSAVLSRYPIKNVEVFQLRNQGYDWYYGEKPKIAFVEKTRRFGTAVLFKNSIAREMKVGGRIFFRVDLEVPDLPERTLTVINIHLEIKCKPEAREVQLAEILGYIKNIRHPVLMLGDFNAAPNDLSPVTAPKLVKNAAKDPNTYVNLAVTFLTPYGALNLLRGISNVTKNLQNPLARDVPVVAPNPLKALFQMIEDYRFADGGAFDFRGDRERSMNRKSKTLANSNERDLKGFKTSFQVRRPIGPVIGKLRLDWVFVKSFLKDPEAGPYKFAPHFGETCEELNTKLKVQISDHHPNVVDLPFEEPKKISG